MSYGGREVIVEVGPGGAPATGKSKLVREKVATGQAIYIGVDVDSSYLNPYTDTGGEHYVLGTLGNLPIKTEIADKVWVWNVFGDRLGDALSFPNRRRDGRSTIPSRGEKYFYDLARILKIGGRVIIAEDNTPLSWLAEVDYGDFGLQKEVLEPGQFIKRYSIESDFFQGLIWNAEVSRVFGPPVFLELTKVGTVNSTSLAT